MADIKVCDSGGKRGRVMYTGKPPVKHWCQYKQRPCEYANSWGKCLMTACVKHGDGGSDCTEVAVVKCMPSTTEEGNHYRSRMKVSVRNE